MPWRRSLIVVCLFFTAAIFADDQALWREYGLVHTATSAQGKLTLTTYQMKDLTGALAAWEWLRPPDAKSCRLTPVCAGNGKRTLISDDNYLLAFDGGVPTKAQVDADLQRLPNKRGTSLPAIITFIPRQGLMPNSSRYVLGPDSLQAFAPELASTRPGFNEGAEAQLAQYKLAGGEAPVRLAIFYYPAPEMARLHAVEFKLLPGVRVKRSSVLVALVFPPATDRQADTILSRIEYEAKITWNDSPPPSPIKPLYRLLTNIIYASIALSVLCLAAGLIYAAMRIYRRRYGTLDSQEAMTTLNLTGD